MLLQELRGLERMDFLGMFENNITKIFFIYNKYMDKQL